MPEGSRISPETPAVKASPGAASLGRRSDDVLRDVLARVAAQPEKLAAILDGAPCALVAFDHHRRVLHANRATEEMFGHPPGALTGVLTDVLVPERLRQPQAPPLVPTSDIVGVDLPGLRSDGSELPIEWVYGSVSAPSGSGSIFVMTLRDRATVVQALDELRASEERFRLLVDGVQDYAIYMLDPGGNVSSWNTGAQRTKGWTAAEIIGRPYETFFSPEDRAAGVPVKLLATAVREGKVESTGWRVRKDGSRFLASVYLAALRSPAGELRGFAKVTRDLTEKLQAEEIARRLDVERESRVAAEAAEERVRASEERLRRLQRVTAALSGAVTPQDVTVVALDQVLGAFEAAGGALYALTPDGLALEMLGQRGLSAEGVKTYSRLPVDLRAPLADAVRERKPMFYESVSQTVQVYPHLRAALERGAFEASVALPLLTHGSLLGAMTIRFRERRGFDASDRSLLTTLSELCAQALDRARLFEAESRARNHAESASRSKDEFLAVLGHELRNPLAPIVTALRLMQTREPLALQKERNVIERHVSHMVRLVDDLLDVARITEGKVDLKKETVELSTIVARAVELVSPLLEQRRHHLALLVPTTGLPVHADPMRLAQVVSNLLTNSAKYTEAGGHIEISASREHDTVTLTVRDDGVGIAPGVLPYVFDLFSQGTQSIDRSLGGLGLGLAIVRNLVAMHGGTVSAASEGTGKGSVFTVQLPAASALPASTDKQRIARPAITAGRRVLVVDDNPDGADLLAESLRSAGHTVEIAYDGPAALELAATFHPDVALLDIGLPVMDGFELARRLREQLGTIRLIAITGYGQETDRARSREAGFDAHMVKPVDLDELQSALSAA